MRKGSRVSSVLLLLLMQFFFAKSAYTSDGVAITNGLAWFSSLKIPGDTVTISDYFGRIGSIKHSGPDVVTNWANNVSCRLGDIVRMQGGQENEYWEILAVSNQMVKVHYFGFVRGIGSVDDVFWIPECDDGSSPNKRNALPSP